MATSKSNTKTVAPKTVNGAVKAPKAAPKAEAKSEKKAAKKVAKETRTNTRYQLSDKIILIGKENPHRKDSDSFKFYAKLKNGMTVKDYDEKKISTRKWLWVEENLQKKIKIQRKG